MKRHKFKHGDGIRVYTSSPNERRTIRDLLVQHNYPITKALKQESFDNVSLVFNGYARTFVVADGDGFIKQNYKYSEMCDLIKHIEEKPKDGWYVDEDFPNWMVYVEKSKRLYGIEAYGTWKDEYYWEELGGINSNADRLAASDEIEEKLWKEANKRGLFKFTKLEECLWHGKNPYINKSNYIILYDLQADKLWNKSGCIYRKGKWATPLKEEVKQPKPEKDENIQFLRMALNLVGIGIDYKNAELFSKVYEGLDKYDDRGMFDLGDAAKIKANWNKKWNIKE